MQVTFRTTDGNTPTLSLTQLSPEDQCHFQVVYQIPVDCVPPRDRYEGRPFLSGEKTIQADSSDPARILNLSERIVFPIEEKGV
mgnify:CR=1 FL=1